jgi:antitoxin (DNA-binding transcriptional repressor) of toxin-antitoxin stability system
MEYIVGLKDFRMDVEKYANAVEKGASVVVARKSKPLFRLSPVNDDTEWEAVVDFTKIKKGGIHINDLLNRL